MGIQTEVLCQKNAIARTYITTGVLYCGVGWVEEKVLLLYDDRVLFDFFNELVDYVTKI